MNAFQLLPKLLSLPLAATLICVAATPAYAAISASGSATQFGDSYGFRIQIDQLALQGTTNTKQSSEVGRFSAALTNTSAGSLSNALIDAIAFNLNTPPQLTLGTGGDFFIESIRINDQATSDWVFSEFAQNDKKGVKFDYVGAESTPEARLAPSDVLAFEFVFYESSIPPYEPEDPFSIFLESPETSGAGLGGGEDYGQFAVSFQQLGQRGDDSDLVAANWQLEQPRDQVPEPMSLAIWSVGGIGALLLARCRRKPAKK